MRPPPLEPVIHQPARLAVMAALFRNREMSAADLREGLGLTAGNLASHAARLQDAGFVDARHALVGVSFQARYRITEEGAAAFRRYLAALRAWTEAFGPDATADTSATTTSPSDGAR